MPTIPLSAIFQAAQAGVGSGSDTNTPFVYVNGQYTRNPSFLDATQQAQLSQTVNGPTKGAIQGGAAAEAAKSAATIGAQQALIPQTQIPATELQNLIDPSTNSQLPLGTTYGQAEGKQFISPSQQTTLQGLSAVQNIIDQVKEASRAVNVESSPGGILGNRSGSQALHALKLQFQGDSNLHYLTTQVKGQLGELASGALGVNRFNPDEITAIQSLIPTPYDTKEVAGSKIKHLQDLVDIEKKAIIPQVMQQATGQPAMGPSAP